MDAVNEVEHKEGIDGGLKRNLLEERMGGRER